MNEQMIGDQKGLDAAGVGMAADGDVDAVFPFGPFGPRVGLNQTANLVSAYFGPQQRVQPYLSARLAVRLGAKVLRDEIHRRFEGVAEELGGTVMRLMSRVAIDLGDAMVFTEAIWRDDRPVDTVDILVRLTNGPTVTVWTSDDCNELPRQHVLAGIIHDAIMDAQNERN